MPFSISLPELSDTLFIIISMFLVVEILSQLLKFELIGKIYIQFYVLLMHVMITLALISYESRELTIYFITLIAFINSLRFMLYKLPSLTHNHKARFFFDIAIVMGLIILLVQLIGVLNIDIQATTLSTTAQYGILVSLGVVLLYEMIQRANDIGLDIRDYLPRSLPSFLIVFAGITGGIYFLLGAFTFRREALSEIYTLLPLYIVGTVLVMGLIGLVKGNENESYSLLYVLPTFVMFGIFISIFVTI